MSSANVISRYHDFLDSITDEEVAGIVRESERLAGLGEGADYTALAFASGALRRRREAGAPHADDEPLRERLRTLVELPLGLS